MIPKILELEEGRIKITENAFMMPELKAIIDKYDMKAEPYLAYVHFMTHPESSYINIEESEKKETIIYDVIQTQGDFDIDEPLLEKAINKLDDLYMTRTRKYFRSVSKLMDKVGMYADTANVSDENLADVNRTLKDVGATMKSFKEAEKQIDEELKTKMKGKNILGDY